MAKGEELVKQTKDVTTVERIPEHLQKKAGETRAGFEETEASDTIFPRLKVCQNGTPERDDTDPKYIEGLAEGEFFNSMTRVVYGRKLRLVPLMVFKNRIRFRAKEAGGGMLCRADDNKKGVGDPGGVCLTCKFSQFGTSKGGEGKGTDCTQFFNFPSIIISADGSLHPENMVIASFKSSDIPEARTWIGKMNLRGIDMFGGVYEFTTAKKKFTEGTSFIQIVRNSGLVGVEALGNARMVYELFYRMRKEARLKMDESGLDNAEENFNPDDEVIDAEVVDPAGRDEANQ